MVAKVLKPLHKAIVHKINSHLKDISTPKEGLIHLQESDPAIKPIIDYLTKMYYPLMTEKQEKLLYLVNCTTLVRVYYTEHH